MATGGLYGSSLSGNLITAPGTESVGLYGTLEAYYDKNKNTSEAEKWRARFDEAYGLIEDQNFKDKWRGGDQHLTSEFQPRDYRYSFR